MGNPFAGYSSIKKETNKNKRVQTHAMVDSPETQNKYRLTYVSIVILILLFGGAALFSKIEQWRYLDALYFSAATMTTIGYGDFVPKTDTGKMLTIVFAFSGIGSVLYGLSLMATNLIESRERAWQESSVTQKIKTIFGRSGKK